MCVGYSIYETTLSWRSKLPVSTAASTIDPHWRMARARGPANLDSL